MIPIATGLLGGSFDPVHNGHLALGSLAVERLGIAQVLFIPASRPPHKTERSLSGDHHRFAMLALATLDEPRFRVSAQELVRAGRSYTIDTLRSLHRTGGGDHRWCFLAGADAFAEIETWKKARQVVDLADFIVFPRNGIGFAELRRRVPSWAAERLVEHPVSGLPGRKEGRPGIYWMPLEVPDISSTEVRRRAASGGDLTALVPAAVARYIERYRLYRNDRGAAH
ncbi:MAG: nicotinate-nucleotide adenylyltransferase [Acidobacteriota bacterium]